MNDKKRKFGEMSAEDRAKAIEKKKELRDWTKYKCPDDRKALGHDDSWYRKKMEAVPAAARARMNAVFHGEASALKAIEMMCYQCIGYGNVKESVADCRGSMCPLFAYRPHK